VIVSSYAKRTLIFVCDSRLAAVAQHRMTDRAGTLDGRRRRCIANSYATAYCIYKTQIHMGSARDADALGDGSCSWCCHL
jgi:hypothetical protein